MALIHEITGGREVPKQPRKGLEKPKDTKLTESEILNLQVKEGDKKGKPRVVKAVIFRIIWGILTLMVIGIILGKARTDFEFASLALLILIYLSLQLMNYSGIARFQLTLRNLNVSLHQLSHDIKKTEHSNEREEDYNFQMMEGYWIEKVNDAKFITDSVFALIIFVWLLLGLLS